MSDKQAVYPVVGPGEELPPDYGRVVRGLSDADLEDEILARKGDPGYQAALVAEHERRSREGASAEPPRRRPSFDSGDWDDAA